jgi:hypothetical protein
MKELSWYSLYQAARKQEGPSARGKAELLIREDGTRFSLFGSCF